MLRLLRTVHNLNNPCYHRMVTSTLVTRYRQYSNDIDLIQLLQDQSGQKAAADDQPDKAESPTNLSDLLTSMKIDRTSASYNITPEIVAQNAAVIDIVNKSDKPVGKPADQSIQKSKQIKEEKQEKLEPAVVAANHRDRILNQFQDVTNWTPNYHNKIQDVSQYNDLMRDIFPAAKFTSDDDTNNATPAPANDVPSNNAVLSKGEGALSEDGPRLNIFTKKPTTSTDQPNRISTFERANESSIQELRDRLRPVNGYTKLMDNSNKHWQFPIDNEVAKSGEEGISFDQHIHLQHHLKDFPENGSVRHFASLVITGLQQNSHLSVSEKVQHIEWYKKFFRDKQDELE